MFGLIGRRCCIGARRELFFISCSSYSTATAGRETSPLASSFLPDFLANSLGFSQKESITIAAKVSNFTSTTKPILVVDILKETGLNSSQIRKCVSKFPRLLYFDVDKTLRPKLECLQELGFSSSDLADILVKGPDIFTAGLDTYLKPNVATLTQIFGGNTDDLRRTIKSYPWLLRAFRCGAVLDNVSYFKELGFSTEQIRWFITIRTQPMTYPTKWFQERVDMLENDFGILRGSPMFFYGVYAMSKASKSNMDKKLAIFRSFGWSESEIVTMFHTQPCYFTLSEANIRKKLDYYMNKLGWKPAYMSTLPFLTYSLEKRVIPRVEVVNTLKEKKLPSLYGVLCLTEPQFEKRFLLPYKDVLPGMYESYKKKVGR